MRVLLFGNSGSGKTTFARRLAFLLDWVRGYYARTDDLSLAAHRRIFDAFPGPKREIVTDEDAAACPLLS